MRIIDGILRFEIAKELGLQELNAVVVSDANEEELLQLELSLNRLAEDGAWDTGRLKSKFEQLIEYNVDLTFTGFETAEIDNILSFEVIEPDDQIGLASDPVTQFGDIWQVGDHIIACGNALAPDEVLGDVLDGLELAKACITDPPYNVPTVGHIRTTHKHARIRMAAGEMDDQDFTEFLSRSITASCPTWIRQRSIISSWIGACWELEYRGEARADPAEPMRLVEDQRRHGIVLSITA